MQYGMAKHIPDTYEASKRWSPTRGPVGFPVWRSDLKDMMIQHGLMQHVGKPPPSAAEAEKLFAETDSTSGTNENKIGRENKVRLYAEWKAAWSRAAPRGPP